MLGLDPRSPSARRRCMHAAALAMLFASLSCASTQPCRVVTGASSASLPAPGGSSPFDVLTQHGNPQRTGANLHETLTPADLQSGNFQRLFDWEVDGQIYAQPLYLSEVKYGARTINMVIVATMNNSVYAFEAPAAGSDVRPSRTPLWHVSNDVLGTPLPFDFFPMAWGLLGHNIEPQIGITATPVADRRLGTLYVTAKSGSGGFLGLFKHVSYQLFAIDLLTGAVKRSVDIEAQFAGADGSITTFDAQHHLQRPGLLQASGRIYLGFGAHQDTPPYHGWLLAYDERDLHQVAAYCTTCGRAESCAHHDKSNMGGIWQAGGGPAVDLDGNLYVMTGNGSVEAAVGDRGTSFIKLDRDLNVIGSWTPVSFRCLNYADTDLGSAGPLYLTQTETLVGGGKEGLLYALKPEALRGTHFGTGKPGGVGQPCRADAPKPDASGPGYTSVQAAPPWHTRGLMDLLRGVSPESLSQGYHHIHGSPVSWTVREAQGERTLLYVSAERDLLRAFAIDNGVLMDGAAPGQAPTDTYHSRCTNSDHGMPGGFLTLSANGSDPASGIVWASMPRRNKDALNNIVPGVLRAYRAYPNENGELVEIWNSDNGTQVAPDCHDPPPAGDSEVGLFAKYAAPTVTQGKVYLPTFSHRLAVYGLKHATPPTAAPAAYDAKLAISALPPIVTPGTSVAIAVTATNTGTATWRKGDNIHLDPNKLPRDMAVPQEGATALVVPRDVPPGQNCKFAFHLMAPRDEATYYLNWRLARESRPGDAVQFGGSTTEWTFTALRPECADLRKRVQDIIAKVPENRQLLPSQRGIAAAAIKEAEERNCAMRLDAIPGGMGHAP